MMQIDRILALRQAHASYDEELWAFLDRVDGPRLINLSDEDLQRRLDHIERNIQYLDAGSTPRDTLPPERGWLSPWWWLRSRYWTLLEFQRRRLATRPTLEIPPMPTLAPGFQGVVAGGGRLLARISAKRWLLPTLEHGVLRFAPASGYSDSNLNAARMDEEMNKTYQRPGVALQVAGPNGRAIKPIGDVSFSTRRIIEQDGRLQDTPYWLCSFSSDLDPRLFNEIEFTKVPCGTI